MKKRQGFVSNSSSSSFIIATNGNSKIKMEVDIDLEHYADTTLTTIKKLDELYKCSLPAASISFRPIHGNGIKSIEYSSRLG